MLSDRTSWQASWTLTLALMLVAIAALLQIRARLDFGDVVPFICGGESVRHHASLYLIEPLQSCEIRRFHEIGLTAGAVPTPAPLPPYALAFFMLFSYLPTAPALAVWYLLLTAAIVGAVYLLHKMTRRNPIALAAAFFVPAVYVSFTLGQVVPLVVGAMVTAAWAVLEERPVPAALGALFCLIEPHIGLPIVLAVFLTMPRARLTLAVGAVMLAVCSLAAAPWSEHLQYFREVLPAQALSELPNDEQFSLAHILWLAHVPERSAALIGSLFSVGALGIGVWLAVRLARQPQLRGLAIFAAPGIALLGSVYAHSQQFAVLGVLAVAVWAFAPTSRIAQTGVLGVALPLIVPDSRLDLIVYALLTYIIASTIYGERGWNRRVMVLAVAFAVKAVEQMRAHLRRLNPAETARYSHDLARVLQHAQTPNAAWSVLMRENVYTKMGWYAVAIDLPLWFGAGCVIWTLLTVLRNEERSNQLCS